jgi:hypothetical protein
LVQPCRVYTAAPSSHFCHSEDGSSTFLRNVHATKVQGRVCERAPGQG